MTKKEFKRAMQCGLGRCIQELRSCEDIEKYRDIVLWGCTRNLAYDAQSEGTRSDYLYQLVKCYPDESPFVDAVILSLQKSCKKSGWDFLQFCCFLELFAKEGNQSATDALHDQYKQMYDMLKKSECPEKTRKKVRSQAILPVLENFENLCISIIHLPETPTDRETAFLNIIENTGSLIINTSLFQTWDFAWFQACAEDTIGKNKTSKLLKQSSKSSENVKTYMNFLAAKKTAVNAHINYYQKAETITAAEIYETLQSNKISDSQNAFPILLAAIMYRKGNGAETARLADYYQKETDVFMRSQLLRLLANRHCARLLQAKTVIEDSRSDNTALQKNAFRALEYMKDDAIHDYALELLQNKEYSENIIYMLANNYHEEDYNILVSMVKNLPVTYQEKICWHGPYSAILDMFEKGATKHPPKELLPYLYEHTLCSCCREYTLREMSRRRMVSRQLLEECLYDSNDGIRKFAGKRLKGR